MNNVFIRLSAISLIGLSLGVSAAPGQANDAVCSVQAEAVAAKAEFVRLADLRDANPSLVSADAFRSAAADYVRLAETCYVELHGQIATTQIDDGGVWFDGGAADGSDPFVTFGTKWGAGSPFAGGTNVPGPRIPGGEVTYSFIPDGVDNDAEEAPPNTAIESLATFDRCFIGEIQVAFAAWSAVADISFREVADNGLPFNAPGATGDIRIGAHAFDGAAGILAHAYFPPPNGDSAAGDIHFDENESWSCESEDAGVHQPAAARLDVSFDIGIVMIHELGHAIGMGHETTETAIMNPFYNPAVAVLQPDDIEGVGTIYNEFAGTGPGCGVVMSATVYSGSDMVTVTSLSLSNGGPEAILAEWKVWLEILVPGVPPFGIINEAADGSLVLPPGFFADLGPLPAFPAEDVDEGDYLFGCRIVDPTTGETLAEDFGEFAILPDGEPGPRE